LTISTTSITSRMLKPSSRALHYHQILHQPNQSPPCPSFSAAADRNPPPRRRSPWQKQSSTLSKTCTASKLHPVFCYLSAILVKPSSTSFIDDYQTGQYLFQEMHTQRIPRRRPKQGRIRLHRPLCCKIYGDEYQDWREDAGGCAGQGHAGAGWWRWRHVWAIICAETRTVERSTCAVSEILENARDKKRRCIGLDRQETLSIPATIGCG